MSLKFKASRKRSFCKDEVKHVLCELYDFDESRTNLTISEGFVELHEVYQLNRADDGRFDVV